MKKKKSGTLPLGLLRNPTRYLFFTGKGGVGKTSLACAVALTLSDSGRSVLLVSTDPASNLDEMLGQKLTDMPSPLHADPARHPPEITPVSEAAGLQEDLRRAAIEPYAWVVNRSRLASGTRDPLLAARLAGERLQIQRVRDHLAARVFVVPWQTTLPVGIAALSTLGGKRAWCDGYPQA